MVEPTGGQTLNECVFVLRASNFDSAFDRAISIGEASQKEYRNAYDERVFWRFMEVVSLDVIPFEDLDGREVYSELVHLGEEKLILFGTEFNPKSSKPVQTI